MIYCFHYPHISCRDFFPDLFWFNTLRFSVWINLSLLLRKCYFMSNRNTAILFTINDFILIIRGPTLRKLDVNCTICFISVISTICYNLIKYEFPQRFSKILTTVTEQSHHGTLIPETTIFCRTALDGHFSIFEDSLFVIFLHFLSIQLFLICLLNFLPRIKSSHRMCSVRKDVLRNEMKRCSCKIHKKTPVPEPFFNKVVGLRHRWLCFHQMNLVFSSSINHGCHGWPTTNNPNVAKTP